MLNPMIPRFYPFFSVFSLRKSVELIKTRYLKWVPRREERDRRNYIENYSFSLILKF